jgi:hypothetical protein
MHSDNERQRIALGQKRLVESLLTRFAQKITQEKRERSERRKLKMQQSQS